MLVTPDVIGVIVAIFVATVTFSSVFLGALRHQTAVIDRRFDQARADVDARFARVDARFDRVDAQFARVDAQFDRVDARFAQVDAQFEKVGAEIAGLRDEVVEVKIGLARLEGPQTRLLRTGR